MNTLVIYDSTSGNTATVAEAIAAAAKKHGKVTLLHMAGASPRDLTDIDLLIVGSPTQGGQPTRAMQDFLHELPDLDGMQVAAFDTRFATHGHGPVLGLLMRVIGYAAEKMTKVLESKGGRAVLPPQGFIVDGKTGPLHDGVLDAAAHWLDTIPEFAR